MRAMITLLTITATFISYSQVSYAQGNVKIEFISALISPTKVNNKKWDGFGKISSQELHNIRNLAQSLSAADPYFGIIQLATRIGVQGSSLPDVFGYVSVVDSNRRIGQRRLSLAPPQSPFKDSFTPKFRGAIIDGINPKKGERVQITLYDKDLRNDDHIDTIEIHPDDIIKALKSKKTYNVDVSRQGSGQILHIQISVTKTKTKTPQLQGNTF